MALTLVPWALLFIAGLLLRLGWRGRTISDHPVCRRCGFDLFGLPSGSAVCSECGADLAPKKAIHVGHREHRKGMLGAGGFLLLIAGAWVLGVASYEDVNLQPYKPVWWLAREVRGADVPTRNAALAEIVTRYGAGKLSQPQIDAFADRGLELQGNPTEPWVPAWGDWIEATRAKGSLSDERWQRYLDQAIVPQLEVRRAIRRSDTLPYRLKHANARLGRSTRLSVDYTSIAWQIDSETLHSDSGVGGFDLSVNGSSDSGRDFDLEPLLPRLKDGAHTLRATLDLTIGQNGPFAGHVKRVLTGNFELRPASASRVAVIDNPTLRAAVENSIRISQAEYGRSGTSELWVTVQLDRPPVGLGYEVFAVADGKTFKLGRAACPAGTVGHGWGFRVDAPGLDGSVVDIVFKPSAGAAMSTTDTYAIWGGEITMRDIKVDRARAAPDARKGT